MWKKKEVEGSGLAEIPEEDDKPFTKMLEELKLKEAAPLEKGTGSADTKTEPLEKGTGAAKTEPLEQELPRQNPWKRDKKVLPPVQLHHPWKRERCWWTTMGCSLLATPSLQVLYRPSCS